mmetsp:Transcript_37124/g.80694  ORF Transcript_37124/g.80694 Transcript_37124/m.80694 type:complete len:383 (+) Transcript_37124:99-1247(+)
MMRRALCLAVSALTISEALADHAPRRYQLDLNVEPAHRWDAIALAEKDLFKAGLATIYNDEKLKNIAPILKKVVGNKFEARRVFPKDVFEEFEGIARVTEVEFEEVAILGMFYDLFAAKKKSPVAFDACSGIIAQTASGEIIHGRNLDYSFTSTLQSLAIVVDFVRNNDTKFTAVTFGPNPTFNTGVRYGMFSVTQDERDRGNMYRNWFDIAVLGRPALFASIRQTMESEEVDDFDKAIDFFSKVPIAAASYLIVAGVKPGEGAVVTRSRTELVDVWRLNATAGRWFLVETNYDHFEKPRTGDDRRDPEIRAMEAIGQQKIDADGIWSVLSIDHVNRTAGEREPMNTMTIYTTVMQASKPSTFRTLVRGADKEEQENTVVLV